MFSSHFAKRCVIKWQLKWLLFALKTINKGSDLLELFENLTGLRFFETLYIDKNELYSASGQQTHQRPQVT